MNFTTGAVCVEQNDDDDIMLVYVMTERLAKVQVTGQYSNRDGKQVSQITVVDANRINKIDD